MTKSEVKTMLKKEKEKASTSIISLNLKPPYPTGIATKPYPITYVAPQFQKFDGRRENTR